MFRDYTKYEVFEDGRIWSYKTNRFLKPETTKCGYQQVALSDNEGKIKMYLVHRVVYEAVTGEPIPEGMQINHRNEIKTANMITNLELMTPKQNSNYGTRNERMSNNKNRSKAISKANTNNTKLSKQVGAFKNGELVMKFASTMEAKRQGFHQGNVAACCRGERNTHKGFEWRYI